MTSNHTKGPWKVIRGQWDDNGDACYSLDGVKDIKVADARLIQAAPSLLAALKLCVNKMHADTSALGKANYSVVADAIDKAINGVKDE